MFTYDMQVSRRVFLLVIFGIVFVFIERVQLGCVSASVGRHARTGNWGRPSLLGK